jgi:membrane protein
MAVRRRSVVVDVVVETIDGWRRHLTGRSAAALTYYGFLSIFPLFLVGTTVLAFVLEDNPELQQDILDTAVSQIPVIGTTIVENAGKLEGTGGWWTVLVGLLVALWAATKAFVSAQVAFDDIWEVRLERRDNYFMRRLKALFGILIIGLAQIAGTGLSGLASLRDYPLASRLLLLLGSTLISAALLAAIYRFLSARPLMWRMVWPGALLAGAGFTTLQVAGVWIVDRYLRRAADVSGVFATVFALLAWISLHATISLFGAELNAALDRRRLRVASGRATDPGPAAAQAPAAQPSTVPADSNDAEERPTNTS